MLGLPGKKVLRVEEPPAGLPKTSGAFEKPSEKRAREKAEGIRRVRKLARKKLERESGISAPKKARASGR
ncbi:hypothetical protein [Rhizobium lusitanum]|uniref:hypothetical protein n=1 Tax=Rhizobium lusitanum TaxID=293958 RepID=UPI003916EAF2